MSLRMFWLAILVSLISVIHSCTTEITERQDFKEVMKVHDRAMARMGEIYDYKSQIEQSKPTFQDSNLIYSANNLILALESADEGMMDWMAKFKIPNDGSEQELISFFANEQKKVDIVDKDIDNAILKAKEFVDNLKIKE